MSQKGAVPIIVLLVIVGLFVAAGVWYYENKVLKVSEIANQTAQQPIIKTASPQSNQNVNISSSVPATKSYTPSTKDISGLDLAVGTNAELLVIDSYKRQTGFDATSSRDLQDIPQSAYFRDSLTDDVTGGSSGEISHQLNINQPLEGGYQIFIIGRASGTYEVNIRAFDINGGSEPGITIDGKTQKGVVDSYRLQYVKSKEGVSKLIGANTL